jgi:hypothetical protein
VGPALQLVVDDKIAKMEAAAETDMDEHTAGRPATSKLRMLSEVEEFLAKVCAVGAQHCSMRWCIREVPSGTLGAIWLREHHDRHVHLLS